MYAFVTRHQYMTHLVWARIVVNVSRIRTIVNVLRIRLSACVKKSNFITPLLQVKMPIDGDPTRMQRGRVYICDLAGTEPAGDIVYAQYKKGAYYCQRGLWSSARGEDQ